MLRFAPFERPGDRRGTTDGRPEWGRAYRFRALAAREVLDAVAFLAGAAFLAVDVAAV